MKNSLSILGAIIALLLWQRFSGAEASPEGARPAPEFPKADTSRWINSLPLKMTGSGENGLRGKVMLLNVWTFM